MVSDPLIPKDGNRYLAMAFVEAAHFAAIWNPAIQRFYQRRQNRVHKMVAKKTVANKLAKACYHMLRWGVNRPGFVGGSIS
jgi:transposase